MWFQIQHERLTDLHGNTVATLWDSPFSKELTRNQLIQAVIGACSGMVDIPSQVRGVTDEMVTTIKDTAREVMAELMRNPKEQLGADEED